MTAATLRLRLAISATEHRLARLRGLLERRTRKDADVNDKPAFPRPDAFAPGYEPREPFMQVGQDGMTLREWYAGLALQGLLADGWDFEQDEPPEGVKTLADWQRHYARTAVGYADAMLAELAHDRAADAPPPQGGEERQP